MLLNGKKTNEIKCYIPANILYEYISNGTYTNKQHDDNVYTMESSLNASVPHAGEYSNHTGHPCN